MLQRSLSIRWSSPWRNHRWSRTVDGSLKSGEKTSWGRLVVEIPSFTTGFSTIPGGCLGWFFLKINGDSTNLPFHNFSLMARRKTHSGRLHLGPVADLPSATQHSWKSNQGQTKWFEVFWITWRIQSLCGKHHFTTHLNFQNTLEKCFIGFIRFHHLPNNCPPKSPWRTRSSAVRSCGKLSRSTAEPLWLNNGKSCPGLMTKGPQGPQEVSRKSKDVKEEDMEDGQNVLCRMERPLTWGENPLKTLQILPKFVTKDCYLQTATFTNLPLYISILNPLFHGISTCLHHVNSLMSGPSPLGPLGKLDTAQDLVREVARSGVFLGAPSPTYRPWQFRKDRHGVPTVPPFGEAPCKLHNWQKYAKWIEESFESIGMVENQVKQAEMAGSKGRQKDAALTPCLFPCVYLPMPPLPWLHDQVPETLPDVPVVPVLGRNEQVTLSSSLCTKK